MELWIPITIAAAFCQNLRSALQKHLRGRLSTGGATISRFLYAVPFALGYAAWLAVAGDHPLPAPGARFWLFATVGGAGQIVATALLVHLFSLRNFAVGTTYSKTEVIQTALFGIVILGDPLRLGPGVGIVVSLIGVMAISVARQDVSWRALLLGWIERPALIGLASGACFGLSAVSYRAASLSLGGEGFVMQAAFTLAVVTVMQSLAMSLWLAVREPGEMTRVLRAWPVAGLVGLSGMVASACWLTAMTIQNAAYVRALGQIELVFTFVASVLIFRERSNAVEASGIALVIAGIVVLLLWR
ncbi:MAG: EamA family transporter [Gammaproteobacteria bacterium]|nr:EamA family transporter [Gammaproteobacteria bacterium]